MIILMTGSTGILGSVISAELEKLGNTVYYIVRGGIDNKKLPVKITSERIIDGDITKPLCGLAKSSEDYKKLSEMTIDMFLHLAADVSFAIDDPDGAIWKTNYNGTFNALALAKDLDIKDFRHCSTCYAPDQRNPYEISKMGAENLVVNSGLKFSIYRPSAMVGDSETGFTTDYNGYYGVFSFLHYLAQKEYNGNNKKIIPLNIGYICSSTSTLNIITLDWVKYTLMKLLQKESRGEIYHLAHEFPKKVRFVCEESHKALNLSNVIFWENTKERDARHQLDKPHVFQKRFDIVMQMYTPYATFERPFSLDKTKEILGSEYIDAPAITSDLIHLLMNFASQNNFGKKNKSRG